jgi:hypothetical protein
MAPTVRLTYLSTRAIVFSAMQARFHLLAATVALTLGCTGHAGAQTPLAKQNPFGQTAAGPQAAAESTESVEFSGIFVGNKTLVIIYDKVAKKSRMIPVGDTVDGIQVISYDTGREQVSVKIGGEQKLLSLRKSTGATTGAPRGAPAPNPALNFNVPPATGPANVAKIQPPPPAVEPASAAPPPPPTMAPAKPEEPAKPLSIARQEEEARMLVSDLLEIGMAQRKAYEEKQRQTAAAEQNGAANPVPTGPQPPPQPN